MRFPLHPGILFLAVAATAPAGLFAQSIFIDPVIPDNETVVYTATYDKQVYPLTQRTVRKTDNGRVLYEVSSESARQDSRLRIDAATMAVEYAWTRQKKADLVTETETKIIKNTIRDKAGEITLPEFSGLPAVLRGFPFGKVRTLKIKMGEGSDFALTVTMTKEIDIKTAAGVIRCYELEFGMDGFLGAFVPKSFFWYEKDAPHRLIRYQGQAGGPGSPSYTIELAGPGTN
jgi:hypothetical protein